MAKMVGTLIGHLSTCSYVIYTFKGVDTMKYKCGWWTCDLLLVSGIPDDDGYTFEEILELYYPVKAQLFDVDSKDIKRALKEYNKKNKYLKYELDGEYVVRL